MSDMVRDNLIEQIAGLERKTFSDAWTCAGIEDTFRYDYNVIFVVETESQGSSGSGLRISVYRGGDDLSVMRQPRDKELVGYLISNVIAEETELLRIAVSEDVRCRGIGRSLMREYMDYMAKLCEKSFLEVRDNNIAARKLYESLGFNAISIRKNYYGNPVEDAVIYEYEFGAQP